MKASRAAALLTLTDARARRTLLALQAADAEWQQLQHQRVVVAEHLQRYRCEVGDGQTSFLPATLHLQHLFCLGLTRHVGEIDTLIAAAERRVQQATASHRAAQARHLALEAVHRRAIAADTLARERQERRRDDEWIRSLSRQDKRPPHRNPDRIQRTHR